MHDDENVEVEVRAILWRYLNVEGHSDIGRGILERVHSFHFTVWNPHHQLLRLCTPSSNCQAGSVSFDFVS